jgi:NAD(P)-dependent dehydrogenase (short-subunit alcohol dehydrogenase family)
MGKLDGKVAFVTGASRGIGKGIAETLAREGAELAIAARSAKSLAATRAAIKSHGREPLALAADVSDERQVEDAFAEIERTFKRLDLLVNNAGAFDGGPLDEFSIEAWDKVIGVNLRGPFLCTRRALAIMKRQGAGRIINIGSISAQRVRPRSAAYSASKHGLWGLTQVTALEGREYGVTCCCLHPGNVLVERRAGASIPEDEEPMIGVDDIAEVALLMAALPPHVEMLEAIVLPHRQLYVGRG